MSSDNLVPICRCPRCGEKTGFVEKQSSIRTGDNGFATAKVYICSKCGFSPFLLPKIEGYDVFASDKE